MNSTTVFEFPCGVYAGENSTLRFDKSSLRGIATNAVIAQTPRELVMTGTTINKTELSHGVSIRWRGSKALKKHDSFLYWAEGQKREGAGAHKRKIHFVEN